MPAHRPNARPAIPRRPAHGVAAPSSGRKWQVVLLAVILIGAGAGLLHLMRNTGAPGSADGNGGKETDAGAAAKKTAAAEQPGATSTSKPPPVDPRVLADSSFTVSVDHTETDITDRADRKGWKESRDKIVLGRYGLEILQRRDPGTGFPPDKTWGDAQLCFLGKRPNFWNTGNWSPEAVLWPAVRLKGEQKDLPFPCYTGRLEYAALCEDTPDRAIAEFLWQDKAGGLLRVRMVGWRSSWRVGMTFRYFPPPGKQIESIAYGLACHPYEISEREFWQRKRWAETPRRNWEVTQKAVDLDLTSEWLCAVYNRFAQTEAGAVAAVHPAATAQLSVLMPGNISVNIKPKTPETDAVVVVGDWVCENNAQVVQRFFSEKDRVQKELADLSALKLPAPPSPDEKDLRAVEQFLKATATQKAFADKLKANWAALTARHKDVSANETVANFTAWQLAQRDFTALCRGIRDTWVRGKHFAAPAP